MGCGRGGVNIGTRAQTRDMATWLCFVAIVACATAQQTISVSLPNEAGNAQVFICPLSQPERCLPLVHGKDIIGCTSATPINNLCSSPQFSNATTLMVSPPAEWLCSGQTQGYVQVQNNGTTNWFYSQTADPATCQLLNRDWVNVNLPFAACMLTVSVFAMLHAAHSACAKCAAKFAAKLAAKFAPGG